MTVPTPELCTQEPKQCPDGSYVSPSGPRCDFAACPSKVLCGGVACPKTIPAPIGEKIIKQVGQQEGSFQIQKINTDSVDGLWFQAYPVARAEGAPRTLHVGEDIGYACEGISEKLTDINFAGQTITFTKVTGKRPMGGCPI